MPSNKADERLLERDRQTGNLLDRHIEGWMRQEHRSIREYRLINKGDSYMLIMKTLTKEGDWEIAFASGESAASAIRNFGATLRKKEVKWKEDIPYDKRK